MNSMSSAKTNRQYLPQVGLRNVVVGILVKEKIRIFWMFAYLFANSATIYWLSSNLIEKELNGLYANPTIILYFRLLVGSIPLVIGLLFGVPLLSSEYESGTYRFLFTQGAGRWRLVRTIFGVYFVFIVLFSVMTIISINHFLTVQQRAESINIWSFVVFVSEPIMIVPLTLTTFVAGVLLGTLMQRVIPAIAVTMLFVLMLALVFKVSFEKSLGFFVQRLNGSHGDPLEVYKFIASNDSQYLFRFQMAFASLLIIFSLVLVFGSLRTLNSRGLLHRKLRS